MTLLLIYVVTIVLTFASRGINQLLFINDLASICMKIDADLLKSWESDFKLFNFKKINFEYFIPFYNIYKSMKELFIYLYDYNITFNELDKLNIIVPMTNSEKYEYLQNPNSLNLFRVLKKGYNRLHNAKYHNVVDSEGKVLGEVLYEENGDNINIIETYGILNEMIKSEVVDSIRKGNLSKKEEDIEKLKMLKEELLSIKNEKPKVKRKY